MYVKLELNPKVLSSKVRFVTKQKVRMEPKGL